MEFTLSKKVQTSLGIPIPPFKLSLSYRDIWFIFLPLSIISILLFGLGSILYFSVLILRFKKLEKSETFLTINGFTLSKFKRRYFYWDLFDSVRKASFSILTVFSKPMFLITAGIGIVFTGMLMHLNSIPYRKKFHNLMEYFILLSTLLTLFAGLLLFVVDRDGGAKLIIDEGLRNFLNSYLPIMTVVLIIASNVIVISMFLFDVYVRRQKDKKRNKRKKREMEEKKERETKLFNVLDDLHGRRMRSGTVVPWETEHDFQFTINFEEESEPEDNSKSMNQILGDVFSYSRLKKNVVEMKQSVKMSMNKISSNMSKKGNSLSQQELVEKKRKTSVKMANGFKIKSQYDGNVSFLGSKGQTKSK
jgi:uncharacterized membrane protein